MSHSTATQPPTWLSAAEAAAAQRLAAARIPPGSVVLMLSRDEVARLIRETVVWAYGQGHAEGQRAAAGGG